MTTEQKITEIVVRLSGEHEIKPGDDLIKQWYFDSLDHVELCMEIEKEFSVLIRDEDVPTLKSINDFTTYVEKLI